MANRRKNEGLAVVVSVLALLGGGALVGVRGVRESLVPRNFGVVEEGVLYRSGRLTPASMERVVRERGIRTIVDLGAWEPGSAPERVEAETAAALGVQRHVFRLSGDGTGNPNAYVLALRAMMDPANQPVLVHCSAGSQRTSGAVILYRDIVQGKSLDETYPESFQFSHDPSDNPRLRPYLEKWRSAIVDAVSGGAEGSGAGGGGDGGGGGVPGCEPVIDEAPGALSEPRK